MEPGAKCQERVFADRDYHGHLCGRPAFAEGKEAGRMMPLCRIHHPAEREKRRLARGPTRFEREIRALGRQQALVNLAHRFYEAVRLLPPQDNNVAALLEEYERVVGEPSRSRS